MKRFRVLAIGNIPLSDDGVGAQVLYRLRSSGRVPLSARLVDGGTLGFALATELDDCAGLVVDTSPVRAATGTVRCFAGDAMDEHLSRATPCATRSRRWQSCARSTASIRVSPARSA